MPRLDPILCCLGNVKFGAGTLARPREARHHMLSVARIDRRVGGALAVLAFSVALVNAMVRNLPHAAISHAINLLLLVADPWEVRLLIFFARHLERVRLFLVVVQGKKLTDRNLIFVGLGR